MAVTHPLHSGRVIAVQVNVAAVLAAWSAGAVPLTLVAPVALAAAATALVRVRGKWASAWLALAMGYVVRRRSAPPGALLGLAHAGSEQATLDIDGAVTAVLTDAGGPTAILALGDTEAMLCDAGPALPPLATLTTPSDPPVRLRLVLSSIAAPAPGVSGPVATSYRQLTGGSAPAYRRVVLAVQVRRVPGYDEVALRRLLASSVRQIRRRLSRSGIPARPLGPGAVPDVLAELAHDDASGGAAERWSDLTVGGRHHVTFRLVGWPPPEVGQAPGTASVLARLLALPGCAVTLALARDGSTADTHVRLTATGPAELAAAVEALNNQLAAAGVSSERLDGAQLTGLASTLPLGTPDPLPAGLHDHPADLSAGGAGVMLGTNRHGEPVIVRLFRSEPTRAVLVGEPARARLVVLRALALGAALYLQTGRPDEWEPFLRAVGPSAPITVAAPGRRLDAPPANVLQPQLVVLDLGGPLTGPPPLPELPWRTTLVVRHEISDADVDPLARADLVLLAPVSPAEAVLAGAALGLGEGADWLARIRGDMISAAVPRRTVRWAMATPSALERQLLGP